MYVPQEFLDLRFLQSAVMKEYSGTYASAQHDPAQFS